MRPDLHDMPVQRKSAEDEEDDQASTSLAASGSGNVMPKALQAKMESAFDADFSAVRIHEGRQAINVTRAMSGEEFYRSKLAVRFAPRVGTHRDDRTPSWRPYNTLGGNWCASHTFDTGFLSNRCSFRILAFCFLCLTIRSWMAEANTRKIDHVHS